MWYVLDSNRSPIRTSDTYFNVDRGVNPTDGTIWLERVIDDTRPPFDPATQKLVYSSVDDDIAKTRTYFYEVVALTQEEIDARVQAQADDTERQALRQFWIDNLQGDPTTQAEVLAQFKALKRVVRHLARDLIR